MQRLTVRRDVSEADSCNGSEMMLDLTTLRRKDEELGQHAVA